jgi:hypothetical protein
MFDWSDQRKRSNRIGVPVIALTDQAARRSEITLALIGAADWHPAA